MKNYAAKLRKKLGEHYNVYDELLDLSQFGVPQLRTRYFVLAVERGLCVRDPFEMLRERLPSFLRSLGLKAPVGSWTAISDLEVSRGGKRPSTETPGFEEIAYARPRTNYQKFLARGCPAPTNLRLARHSKEIAERFAEIIEASHAEGRLNTTISDELRARYGLKKRALRVLDPDMPSPTITSMPDDLLHYSEPRTLTVREMPGCKVFRTGLSSKGSIRPAAICAARKRAVPRFTQVANAVPPLVARALGELLVSLLATPKAKPAKVIKLRRAARKRRQQPAKIAA